MALMRYEGQAQNVDPLTAIYWVTVTITTLGYGDIVFRSYAGRFFSILVALTGVSILWAVILPLVITPRLERLVRMVPSSAPSSMRNHMIISGYSPTVETLTERLYELKIPFLIIERSADIARSIYRRYPTLWGDPSEPDVLISASIRSARLMIANEK
jgi:voltage-gated potassium channel